jgi:hypothetical protein
LVVCSDSLLVVCLIFSALSLPHMTDSTSPSVFEASAGRPGRAAQTEDRAAPGCVRTIMHTRENARMPAPRGAGHGHCARGAGAPKSSQSTYQNPKP